MESDRGQYSPFRRSLLESIEALKRKQKITEKEGKKEKEPDSHAGQEALYDMDHTLSGIVPIN